jgi:hypothetical protein
MDDSGEAVAFLVKVVCYFALAVVVYQMWRNSF